MYIAVISRKCRGKARKRKGKGERGGEGGEGILEHCGGRFPNSVSPS